MNKKLKLLLFAILILSLCIATVSLSACEENKLTVSYDSNHTVYEWDTLDSLKPYLTVTYKDKDGNINTVTDYVLSGTLAKGKCKVTVTYNDSTTWFICNVSAIEFTESLIFELSDDKNTYTVTGIKGAGTDIVIPPSYNDKPVTEIGMDAFYNTDITSVIIPDSVTSIGDCVFDSCYDLTSVIIGNGVTTIGERAFYSCRNLKNVTIGNGIINIGYFAFRDCSSLTNINYLGTIEDWCRIKGTNNLLVYGAKYKTLVINGKEITGELAIPNTLTAIPSYAFCYFTNITSVTIPDSVTSIGNSAFIGCSSLTNVTIPDSATSIDDWGFAHCNNLTSVTIPDSVTSIGSSVFSDCSSLTSVTIGNSVTSIGSYAFNGCSSLANINCLGTIEDWFKIEGLNYLMQCGTSNKTFSLNGQAVTELVMPNTVTSIPSYAFYGTNITSVTFEENSQCTSIGSYAFYGCSSLTNLTIPDSITSIDSYAFNGCRNLKYNEYDNVLYLGNNSHPYVVLMKAKSQDNISCTINAHTNIIYSNAFSGCSSLTSITIPGSVTSIGESAFNNCNYLSNINYLGTIDNWCKIDGLNNLMNYGTRNKTFSLNGQAVTELVIPNTVTSIPSYAFYYCKNITSVTFEENSQCTRIGSYAFHSCSNLANINCLGTIDNWCKIDGLDNLMYYGGTSNKTFSLNGQTVTELVIPNTVTSIPSYAFYYCKNITSVTFEENSQCTRIGSYAFHGCSNITNVIIPDSVTSIGHFPFRDCNSLANINYLGTIDDWFKIEGLNDLMQYGSTNKTFSLNGQAVTELVIPNTVTSIQYSAFYGTNITSITFEENSQCTRIGSYAFHGCSSLANINYLGTIEDWCKIEGLDNLMYYGTSSKTLVIDGKEITGDFLIPNTVTTISSGAFYGTSITSITIPDSVTSIGSGAFSYCSSLTSVTIPDSVTSIDQQAFQGCINLTNINFNGTITQWKKIAKFSNWNDNVPATKVICTDGVVEL